MTLNIVLSLVTVVSYSVAVCTFVGGGGSVSVCPSRQPLGALAQTLALRALRWKTAKGMAPIITRMLEDAKALVALKAELTAGVRDL